MAVRARLTTRILCR